MKYSINNMRIRRLQPKLQPVKPYYPKPKRLLKSKYAFHQMQNHLSDLNTIIVARVQIVLEGEIKIRRLKINKDLWNLEVKWDIPNRCRNNLDILEQKDVPEELASYIIWAYQRTSPDDDPAVMAMRTNRRRQEKLYGTRGSFTGR